MTDVPNYWLRWVWLTFCLGSLWTWSSSLCLWVAGITGISHHVWHMKCFLNTASGQAYLFPHIIPLPYFTFTWSKMQVS
jgi:hypothetical protein